MVEIGTKIAACIVFTCLFYIATFKTFGILQQCGYHNNAFLRWMKRKDNLFYNRLGVWTLASLLACIFISLCFSLLGVETAIFCGFVTYLCFAFFFCIVDKKYALKVPVNVTGRIRRLSVLYVLLTACVSYIVIALLDFARAAIDNDVYSLFAYAPVCFMPLLLPFILLLANKILSPMEKARNKKFVERAGQVLDQSSAIRVGVVGSYGKTSVKNILNSILSVKYSVIATPESYNTPAGVAKTVNCLDVQKCEIFIAEMGARRVGDVAELCRLVKPDYAIFTGVCAQHMETFKTEENLVKAKSEIIKGTKGKVVCGSGLQEKIDGLDSEFLNETDKEKCLFVGETSIENLALKKDGAAFTLRLKNGESIFVETVLLGRAAAENIALAATLASELGMTAEEISQGIAKIKPVPHRLQLIESGGIHILDDAYNCSEQSAKEAIDALKRFDGGKIAVTPGIVETGILEEKINGELGASLAKADLDLVVLVGETLVGAVKNGYLSAGGAPEKLKTVPTLEKAKETLGEYLKEGDAVLFLNDLPDVY